MPISARIVVSQAGNPPPGGYTDGSRDLGPLLANLVTLSNYDNTGVVGYRWTFSGRVGLTTVDYGLSGLEGPTLTFTPPASVGYGDVYVTLQVWDADGKTATAQAVIGIRAPSPAYTAGIPIPHWKESALGGRVTLDASKGREGRIHELALALIMIAGVGAVMPGGTGTVRVDGGVASAPDYVKVGSNPAASGALRTANAAVAVAARNAANGGDLTLLSSDASDTTILGAVAKPTEINGSTITLSALAQAPGYSAPSGTAFAFSSAAPSFASDASKTLAAAEYNCHDLLVESAVSLTATRDLIVPLTAGGTWRVYNGTTGAQSIRVIGASGTGVTIANGQWATVRANGTNVVSVATAGGGGGSTPTGTGFVHVTAGVQDGAAQLVTNADVDAAAAIAVTKLALGAANTVLAGDGVANAFTTAPTVVTLATTSHLTVGGDIKMDGGWSAITAAANVLSVGSATHFTGVVMTMPDAGTFSWKFGLGTHLRLTQSADALLLAPAASEASFTIQQADQTINSAVGSPTTISAQWATGTNATGGAITIAAGYATLLGGAALLRGGDATTTGGAAGVRAGDGTTTGGAASIAAGTGATNGTISLSWASTPAIVFSKASTTLAALAVAATTSLTYGYADLGTNGATGGVMAVRGQTCTGTTSIGGDTRIGPGGGTSRPGALYLAFGATDVLGATFNSSSLVVTIDSSALGVTLGQAGAAGAGTGALWSIFAQSRTSGTGGEMRIGGGTGSSGSTHGPVTIYVGGAEVCRWDTSGYLNAKKLTGLSGNAFAYGTLDKDISASGTVTLSSSEYCFHDINLTGTMTSATTVVLPATAGGSWNITNNAGGAYACAVQISGGRLYYVGKAQSQLFRCDGAALYPAHEKPAVSVLAEGIIDYSGAINTNTDTTLFTLSALVSAIITGVELVLEPAQAGAGSSVTLTVGTSAGGTQYILSQTITTATTAGTIYGLDTTHLGASFDATKGYVFYSNRTSSSIIARCARGAGGAVTTGKLRYRVTGIITG